MVVIMVIRIVAVTAQAMVAVMMIIEIHLINKEPFLLTRY